MNHPASAAMEERAARASGRRPCQTPRKHPRRDTSTGDYPVPNEPQIRSPRSTTSSRRNTGAACRRLINPAPEQKPPPPSPSGATPAGDCQYTSTDPPGRTGAQEPRTLPRGRHSRRNKRSMAKSTTPGSGYTTPSSPPRRAASANLLDVAPPAGQRDPHTYSYLHTGPEDRGFLPPPIVAGAATGGERTPGFAGGERGRRGHPLSPD